MRLHHAAVVLTRCTVTRDRERITRMARTPPEAWSPVMVDAAASTLGHYMRELSGLGIDPATLPGPRPQPSPPHTPAPAAPPPASTAIPAPAAVLDFDGTLDGLRHIPVSELSTISDPAPFHQAGLCTAYDLLMRVPLRYLDRTTTIPIANLRIGEVGTTIATVTSSETTTVGATRRRIARITIADGTGTITCTYFNAAWQAQRFSAGDEVIAQGSLDAWTHPTTGIARLQMTNPLLDVIGHDTARVLPIYPQSGTAGLTTWAVHRAVREILSRLPTLTDPIPPPLLQRRGLTDRRGAFTAVHAPTVPGQDQTGRARLAYDELLRMQLALGMRRHHASIAAGVPNLGTGTLTGPMIAALPYPLTGAQREAITAITADMARPHPMHRLLQGDVGSGKTTVAVIALLTAVEAVHHAAPMAPTEILAAQLHANVTRLTAGLTLPSGAAVQVAHLDGRQRGEPRRRALADLADGTIHIIVGTHALLSGDVRFNGLGLVVIDEQHRFGVEQRAVLREAQPDAPTPDMLVMTATPIPRTAAMTVFGDLDLTVIDELPPGRTPTSTSWNPGGTDMSNPADPTWALTRSEVAAGRQAYVVCPLVEDSETKSAAAAEDVAEALTRGALRGLRVGLVHGKQAVTQRQAMMADYAAGAIDVLVATTVIEVGVDVPNATVIVVLDAARFGLSQLHQLRGRIGRGRYPSTCLLVGEATTSEGRARLTAMCETTDGFALSEVDLRLRGAGSILGARQHGMTDLHVASLTHDTELLAAAREDAAALLAANPHLDEWADLRAEVHAALGPDAEEWLARS